MLCVLSVFLPSLFMTGVGRQLFVPLSLAVGFAMVSSYVLSSTLRSAQWPNTRFVRTLGEIEALKSGPGKDIYLVGGARTTAGLIDAGLVDELRLIVYPLIVGPGKALFATAERRRALELRGAEPIPGGLLRLTYGIG